MCPSQPVQRVVFVALCACAVVKLLGTDGAGLSYDLSLLVSNGLYTGVDPNYDSTVTVSSQIKTTVFAITQVLPSEYQ